MVDLIAEEPHHSGSHGELRRDFLMASINDGQAFVRATDTKAYVALVTQGLIVGGIINLARLVPNVWDDVAAWVQVALATELALVVVFFLASVVHLLMTVAPAPPRRLGLPDDARSQIFHLVDTMPFDRFRERTLALDGPDVQEQLTAVAFVVAAIHRRKTRWVSRGYRLLIIEVTVAAVFMVTLGASALG